MAVATAFHTNFMKSFWMTWYVLEQNCNIPWGQPALITIVFLQVVNSS